jgi:hypothetical protein
MTKTRDPLNPYEAIAYLFAVSENTASGPTPIIGLARVTFMLFLLAYEEGFPSLQTMFQPSPYGPYAEDLLPHLDTLQNLDMIRIDNGPPSSEHPFEMLTRLNVLGIRPENRPLAEIVQYIAHRYPAYFSDTALAADLIRWVDV